MRLRSSELSLFRRLHETVHQARRRATCRTSSKPVPRPADLHNNPCWPPRRTAPAARDPTHASLMRARDRRASGAQAQAQARAPTAAEARRATAAAEAARAAAEAAAVAAEAEAAEAAAAEAARQKKAAKKQRRMERLGAPCSSMNTHRRADHGCCSVVDAWQCRRRCCVDLTSHSVSTCDAYTCDACLHAPLYRLELLVAKLVRAAVYCGMGL